MAGRRLTLLLLALVILAFVLAMPGALRDALERGDLYVFSTSLFADIPRRLAGPGRLRFVLQPLVACVLGIRDGRADARRGRPPFLFALLAGGADRRELARSSLASIADVVLLAILLDTICQWLILGVAHPGAALLVGPVLISAPYAVTRALVNQNARFRREAPR